MGGLFGEGEGACGDDGGGGIGFCGVGGGGGEGDWDAGGGGGWGGEGVESLDAGISALVICVLFLENGTIPLRTYILKTSQLGNTNFTVIHLDFV